MRGEKCQVVGDGAFDHLWLIEQAEIGIVRRREVCLFGIGLNFRFLRRVVDTAYDFGRESSWRAMHAVSLGHWISTPMWLGLEPGRKTKPPSPRLASVITRLL